MVQPLPAKPETWFYVLKEDREKPEDEQSRWELCSPTRRCQRDVADASRLEPNEDGTAVLRTSFGTLRWITLRHCIVSVTNFGDAEPRRNGSHLVSEAFLERLDPEWVMELFEEIQTKGSLSTEDVGKPEPSPTG